jgi:uncharacterized protein YigA (DUF484 family)
VSGEPAARPEAAPEADDLAAFRAQLRAQPEIVLDDLSTIQALIAATPQTDRQITDLRGVLVQRLEARLETLERTHRSVIAAAYENLAGTSQVQRVVLLLLEQQSLTGFLGALLTDAPNILAVDTARLCLETGTTMPGPVGDLDPGIGGRMVAMPRGAIAAYLALDDTPARDGVVLRPAPPEADLLYGDDTGLARSEALIALELGADGQRGLLAFGAEDARRFSADHGTDLVAFLGGVVERELRRLLGACTRRPRRCCSAGSPRWVPAGGGR